MFNRKKNHISVIIRGNHDLVNFTNILKDSMKDYKISCIADKGSTLTLANLEYKDKHHKKMIKALKEQGYVLKNLNKSTFMYELVERNL